MCARSGRARVDNSGPSRVLVRSDTISKHKFINIDDLTL